MPDNGHAATASAHTQRASSTALTASTASSRRFDLVYPTPASRIMGTELEAIFKHTQPEAVAASRLQRQRRDQRAAKALVKAILRRQFNRYGFM